MEETFEVESTVSQVIAEKIIDANLGHASYRIQLCGSVTTSERPVVRQVEELLQPFNPRQPEPRTTHMLLPIMLLILSYRIEHLGSPIVCQAEKTLKPLYCGDYLFGIHTVASLSYTAHARTVEDGDLSKLDQCKQF